MEDNLKIVDFKKYCATCAYKDNDEAESPCDECLEIPARTYSSKPEKWRKK